MNVIILLAITGIFSMFAGIFRQKQLALPVILLAIIASIYIFSSGLQGDYSAIANNMLLFDHTAIIFSTIILFISSLIFVMCNYYYSTAIEHLTDIFALFTFSIIGALLMVSFQNLTMLFLGTEILSIPLYILAASNRRNLMSNEAGLKYYLMGSFATCFLLLGITLIYGAYGSFDLGVLKPAINTNGLTAMFITGALLVLCAFIFKLAAVPFHFWAPDVYQGSPTVLTAYVSTVVKVAIFGALIKFLLLIGHQDEFHWVNLFILVSIASMAFGNLLSVSQTNFKRLLAYTGIANAGFVLIAMLNLNNVSFSFITYNLTAYSIASIMAFSIYSTVKAQTNIDTIEGFSGLLVNNRLLAIGMIISMLSFAGIPPLAGFFGKYFILVNALKNDFVWLSIIAVAISVIAAYNYLRISAVIVQRSNQIPKLELSYFYRLFIIFCIGLIIVMGIFPDFFLLK
ncbi:MAG: NADH-quinone oxidoreductase subunit N [Saprospiraceae bacterium]|jgi:NADH-quinone oxidoreductase subunit N